MQSKQDKAIAINIKNYKNKSKLITDSERRTLEQRGSDEWRKDHTTGYYPEDGMTKRSNEDSNRNFVIQTRAVARDELDRRSKLTKRDNPKTPLIKEVPFGKDSRPKHDKIAGSILEQDTRDSHLALDYSDELDPISRPGFRSVGFGSGIIEKPKRQDWTRIIKAKKGFKGIVKKETIFKVAENNKPEFVEVRPIKNLKELKIPLKKAFDK